jgi:hypothetical protein
MKNVFYTLVLMAVACFAVFGCGEEPVVEETRAVQENTIDPRFSLPQLETHKEGGEMESPQGESVEPREMEIDKHIKEKFI